MRGARLLQLILLVVLSMALPVPFAAQASKDKALTNSDIVRMMKAGIPESIIVRKIEMSKTNFGTSAGDLIELKNQGASEGVLGAVLDSHSGTRQSSPEQSAPAYAPAQSASTGLHHLPTFEAAVRINPTTNEKISVGKNHIKVEQAGVPLFTLKWKDNGK